MVERAPLMGRKSAEDKKLISVNYDIFRQLHDPSEFSDVMIDITDQFASQRFYTLLLTKPCVLHMNQSNLKLLSQHHLRGERMNMVKK